MTGQPNIRRSSSLTLEILEGRTLPSGSPHGPAIPPPVQPPIVAALVDHSGGNGSSGGSGSSSAVHAPRLAEILPLPGQPGVPIQDLFSGYPLPPSIGPKLGTGLLSTTYVSTLPVNMQDSAVAVIPIALTGMGNATVLNITPPAGYTISIVTVVGANGPGNFMVLSFNGTVPTSAAPSSPAPVGTN